MLFINSIETYINWKKTHATTAPDRYSRRLFQFADYIGKNTPIEAITGDDVINFHRYLAMQSYSRGNLTKKYSLSTVAYSTRILKNFFMFWQGRGMKIVNPKEILPVRHVTPIKRIVTKEDFEKMSESLNDKLFDQVVQKLVIHLLWDTGMRISELADLDIADINDVDPEHGLRTATIRTRKTMKYNLVVWSKATNDLLNKYLGYRLCLDISTDALIVTKKGKWDRVTTRTMQRWIADVSRKCQISKISPHSFRHGKGHHILNTQGGNVRDIHAILRHVRPESSFQYLALNQKQFLQTASKYLEVA